MSLRFPLPKLPEEFFLTEASTGKRLPVLRENVKEIRPCYDFAFQYGLYEKEQVAGQPNIYTWSCTIDEHKKNASQLIWRDGRPDSFVLHPYQEIAALYSFNKTRIDIHMNPLLVRRFVAKLDMIEERIEQGLVTNEPHMQKNYAEDNSCAFDDDGLETFPVTTRQVRAFLAQHPKKPLGQLERIPSGASGSLTVEQTCLDPCNVSDLLALAKFGIRRPLLPNTP